TDRPDIVEERRGILRHRLETELIRDVLEAVAVVVDEDLVQDVIAELEEVRAARGLLERYEVRENRDLRGIRGIDERVEVRVVRDGILRNRRRLAMGRHGGSPLRVRREARDERVVLRDEFLRAPHD